VSDVLSSFGGVDAMWRCGGGGAGMRWGWCGNEVVWWYGIGENRMMSLVRWCRVAVIGAVEVVVVAVMVYLIN
jgi:hypothetical protein